MPLFRVALFSGFKLAPFWGVQLRLDESRPKRAQLLQYFRRRPWRKPVNVNPIQTNALNSSQAISKTMGQHNRKHQTTTNTQGEQTQNKPTKMVYKTSYLKNPSRPPPILCSRNAFLSPLPMRRSGPNGRRGSSTGSMACTVRLQALTWQSSRRLRREKQSPEGEQLIVGQMEATAKP